MFTYASWKANNSCMVSLVKLNGKTILSWSRRGVCNLPTLTEAQALLLASFVVINMSFKKMLYFSDSQECILIVRGHTNM